LNSSCVHPPKFGGNVLNFGRIIGVISALWCILRRVCFLLPHDPIAPLNEQEQGWYGYYFKESAPQARHY
jgi:hypothetical protein